MIVRRGATPRWRSWSIVVMSLLFAAAPMAHAAEVEDDGKVYQGIYSNVSFQAAQDLDALAAAAGRRVTFGGTFHHIYENTEGNPWSNTREQLDQVWQGKATPFANVIINNASAATIASGAYDSQIHVWASHVEQFLDRGGGRSLIIAPLQEMNGDWVPWGCQPGSYAAAYRKFVDIFRARGIDETQVRWAFAPNGWTTPGCGTIADYYPGDGYVDVLAFSAYNFGDCFPEASYESVAQAMRWVDQVRALGPLKPIIISQTGSPRPACGGDQSQWVGDLHTFLAAQPNVVGFVWFNLDLAWETDWRVWTGSSVTAGWRDAAQSAVTKYQWPLTSWFSPGPLVVDPPDPPCPDGKTCDSFAVVDGGGRWSVWPRIDYGVTPGSFFFGNPGDLAFVGDWDCDGVSTPGLYRQSDGFVYLRKSNTQGIADIEFFFGNPGDEPLIGDFDGDGCDTVSIYRPSTSQVFVVNELGQDQGGLGAAEFSFFFGNPGDSPFVGDFDGDGVDTVGLHRASTGFVYFRNSLTSGVADLSFFYGDPGDVMMAGDWDGDGDDTVAVYRPSTGTVYLNFQNAAGPADYSIPIGSFTAAAAGPF